jgi:hypothetical protein
VQPPISLLQCMSRFLAHRDRGQGAEFTSAFGGAADVRLWTALAGHDANDPNRTEIGIGGRLTTPLPHHRAYGPYTAVREVELTHSEQGWETERSEVGVGKPQ